MSVATRIARNQRSAIYDSYAHLIEFDGAFNIGAGRKLIDGSRYNAHGTISGATWAAGAHGNCLDFNPATPDYVQIPDTFTHLDFTSQAFSFIARVKIDDLTAIRRLFTRGAATVGGYAWLISTTGFVRVQTFQAVTQTTDTAAGNVTTNTWYTLGFSRSGASVKLYTNGVDVTSVVGTHVNPTTYPSAAFIGIYGDLTLPFDGKMEFFRIWKDIALSESEHLAWHNALK